MAITIVALSIIAISSSGGAAGFQVAPMTTTTTTTSRYRWGIVVPPRRRPRAPPPPLATAGRRDDDWCIDNYGEDEDREGASVLGDVASIGRRSGDDGDDDVRTYFATCVPGLHDALASELVGIGARRVETSGRSGVRFAGSPRVGMKSLLWCRTAHRIMELIASSSDGPLDGHDGDFSGGVRNRDDLYRFVRGAVHVPGLLGNGSGGLLTLSVSTTYAGSGPTSRELCHGHFTALTVKNALVDAAREMREDGDRPDVDVVDPDVPLVVVLRGRRVGFGDMGGHGNRPRGRGGARGGVRDDDRRGGRAIRGDDAEDERETVADVDLYRCLHSGGSLHRRGYRREYVESSGSYEDDDDRDDGGVDDRATSVGRRGRSSTRGEGPVHRAAMKETLAAGLLLEAGWDKLVAAARADGRGAVLVDPMTGSATLPTEAALMACDVAPGLSRIVSWRGDGGGGGEGDEGRGGRDGAGGGNPHRRPPCTRWKDFGDPGDWDDLLAEATRRAKAGMEWAAGGTRGDNVRILCNEKNSRAATLAESSIRNAGVGAIVSLSEGDCADWNLGGGVVEGRTIFVCNPPWGLRLDDDIDESWVSLREFFRREAGGCESWVLSGNKDLTKILRMKK
ncbi:hypothetical protein ACHAW5_003896 [Stephanodiscus triporus]|uniref:Uncharacterized protein n=1 Tax=Stephanodiscus triporus TaxID=2934178 RepID=A0ABD3MQ82_9STRA